MVFDFAWVSDPSAWIGLGTLTLIEIVLGIDNLVFISILASRLPAEQKQKAFRLGLSLALFMRLLLLCGIAWIVSLTQPLLTLWGHSFSARDLILLVGGLFLLFKGTMELHERLEGQSDYKQNGQRKVVFWHVVAQILVLDAVFSLDSVITSVGMAKHLPVMMLAVIIAMIAMLVAARPLINFVERHPTVIVLCLGFLLMIGLSLILDGFGMDLPKGYLYAAIAFSVLVEAFNQLVLRSRRVKITHKNFRESTAKAVLALLSGRASGGSGQLEVAALASNVPTEEVFSAEEREILARVIRLGGRSARYVMTPRRRMLLLAEDATWEEITTLAASCSQPIIPLYTHDDDDILGGIHLGELMVRHAELPAEEPTTLMRALIRPVSTISEHMSLPDLIDFFRDKPLGLALVQDEYGSVVGMVSSIDIVQALAGQGTSSAQACAQQKDGSWHLPGALPSGEVSQLLGKNFDSTAATLAGLILHELGHIPMVGEEWEQEGFHWTVLRMDKSHIELVKITPQHSLDDE